MNGVLNLLKPPGMSSAHAVAMVKRLFHEKVGHAGTLDPEAAGVLPLMVGRATKLFDYISEDYKVYVCELAFGVKTDTGDAEGKVVARQNAPRPTAQEILSVLPRFEGDILQVPPMFSALKRDGQTLYDLARRGRVVALEPRPVHVNAIELLPHDSADSVFLRVFCGKGTYIRTLCEDIAAALGQVGHMRMLVREQVGVFHINRSITPGQVQAALAQGHAPEMLLEDPVNCLPSLPRADVDARFLKQALNGVRLPSEGVSCEQALHEGDLMKLFIEGTFYAISEVKDGMIRQRTLYHL